jgi:hypothetical protein
MATNYKVLGQIAPDSTNVIDLYQVPENTQSVVSTLHVANVTDEETTCSIYVRISGEPSSDSNAVAKDVPISGNSVFALTTGITLGASDVVSVSSSASSALTFSMFGSEIS